ncbi:MAG: hypothetical protein U0640_04015 [Phycisphaerales bacterium]
MRALLLIALTPSMALAQCPPAFQPGEPGESGISDNFSAYVQPMTVYNGQIAFGGTFSIAGPLSTNNLALFDPATDTWSRVGGGINNGNTNGFVAALAKYPVNGVLGLVVGGSFANVRQTNGSAVANTTALAAWDGSQWNSLNTGWAPATGKSVWSLLEWPRPNGTTWLVAGGGWDAIGAATADGIAYWDGQAWNNIGGANDTGIGGTFSPVVFCSTIFNNQLYIGGRFTSVNGVAVTNVARWSGTAWQRPGTLSSGGATSDISSMYVWNDGTGNKLYAGGYDLRIGASAATVVIWNGSVWSRAGQNLGGRGTSLAAFDDGTGEKLYMGMTADAQQEYLYRLENNVWTAVGGGMSVPIAGNFPSVFGLMVHDGSLYVGGDFQLAGDVPSYGIARYGPCDGPVCNDIDFNNDGSLFDPQDIAAFLSVYSEGPCVPATGTCDDIDFNNDTGIFDPCDINSFLLVYSEGPCTNCGV